MNKHTTKELKQMQYLTLDMKIQIAKNRIREWYDYWDGLVYLSFSGGKDSTVLKHIIDSMYDDVPAVFVDTGLEYPEIRKHVLKMKKGEFKGFNTNIEILRPEKKFVEVIEEYGYPVASKEVATSIYEVKRARARGRFDTVKDLQLQGKALAPDGTKSKFNKEKWKFLLDAPFKISAKCCDVMKKKPLKKYKRQTKRKAFVGTMAVESGQRKNIWVTYGCNAYTATQPTSKPLSVWTENDVLEYIKRFDLPLAECYGEIVETEEIIMRVDGEHTKLKTTKADRTGCMFCMFGVHLEKGKNRFQRMKETHPRQYDYCINKLGIGKVLDFIGVPYV